MQLPLLKCPYLGITFLLAHGVANQPHMYGDLLLTPTQEEQLLKASDSIKQTSAITLWPTQFIGYMLDKELSEFGDSAWMARLRT